MKIVITSAVLLSILSHGQAAHTDACFKDIQLTKNGVHNITSPGFPHPYGPNVRCGWKIRASSGNHLLGVYVSYFHLEDSGKCQHANLSFYNGSDTSAGLLLQLCGNEAKESSVLSSGGTMYIEFVSGSVSNGKGFSLTVIDVERCGGRLTATLDKQNFTFSGYPYTYFSNLRCIWIITAENENDTIAASILDTMMGGNIVRVFNGNTTEEEQILGELDEVMYQPGFYSSKDSMLIEFTTDGSISSQGFRMDYKARSEGNCDGSIMMNKRYHDIYIVSPGYPDSYPSNLDCVLTMTNNWFGTKVRNMRLEVVSSDIDGNYPQCDNDSVTLSGVYDEVFIGEFCGNSSTSPVGPYYSNGMGMRLEFKTGNDTSGTGFRLRLSPSSRRVFPPPTKRCGPRFLNATTYPNFLQSPGYPVITVDGLDCVWIITASDPQMMVRIDVIDSDVQTESWDYLKCKDSRVTAYNGPSVFNNTILFWCGVSRPSLQSTGPAMTVQFTSQNSDDKRGFKLKYFETNETFRCGGIANVTTKEDTILTGPYRGEVYCHWTIHAPKGTNIQVNITNVGNPFIEPCFASTYLELYDGTSTLANNGSTTPGKWCDRHDSQYISSGNIITVRLHIDDWRYDGLQLYLRAGHFNASSNNVLTAYISSWDLTSPNYPFDCPRFTESTWKIEGGDSYFNIKITVLKTILDKSDGCRIDYMEAFDGPDSKAPSLGRWCGESTPTKTGSASTMFLKFRSNSSRNLGRRFKISYILVSSMDTPGFSLVGAIVGCCIAGVVVVGMIVVTIRQRANRKRKPLITKK